MRPSKTAPAARCHFNFAHPVTFQSCADTRARRADQQTGDHRFLVHIEPAAPLDECLHPRLPSSEGDRDAAGKFETLPHVLPVPGGDKE
jgi:hypothetical protein